MRIEGEEVFLMDQLTEGDIPQSSINMIAQEIIRARATGEVHFVWISKAPEGKHGFNLRLSMGGLTIHINDLTVPPWR